MRRRNSKRDLAAIALVVAAILTSLSIPVSRTARGDGTSKSNRRSDQEALRPYGWLVGAWRGTGQVERGRARGSWTEQASWAWKLTSDWAALEVTVTKGKHLKSGRLRPGSEPGTYVFDATLADDTARSFTGKAKSGGGKPLVLEADRKAPADGLRRITITPLHDTRLIVLFEAEDADHASFTRLGEVGYTREGVAFAAGESYPVCIVTEGRGTIQVSYKGKSYWVCCSGCRDLFNDGPEAILAEAEARAKAKVK